LFLVWKKKAKPIKYKILLIVWAFILALTSILIKNYTYIQKVDSLSNSTGLISQNMDWPQWNYFVWTWQISDIYSYQRFVFEDNSTRQYFLNSESEYKIWDIIWLNWYVSLGYTWSKNIFNLWQQRDQIRPRGHKTELEDPGVFSLLGFFNYEFDYPKRLMMKWFYGTIYEQNSVIITNSGKNNLSFLQSIRKNLQKNIIQAYWENPKAWLILGMLVWDRSQIPPDEYDWFIDSWLVHIIAVSWWNIIMIVVFLWAVLFFLPFYVRNAVILATIIIYAMICGMDSSVFRATIMWWLWMLALFWWREVNIRRAMSIAFIVMLIINPYFLAYDVWFLLSFSAIIGIVYFGKWVESANFSLPPSQTHLVSQSNLPSQGGLSNLRKASLRREGDPKGGRFVSALNKTFQKITKEYITPTVWATLWVLPVMLFFMGKTNLTWIVANFLVVPIIAVVMIYGFISTILFQIFPRQFILRPEKILVTYIYSISDLAVKRWIYLQAEWAWIKYALLILFVVWFVSERMKK
jgi:ComEC/Rec2-related protein